MRKMNVVAEENREKMLRFEHESLRNCRMSNVIGFWEMKRTAYEMGFEEKKQDQHE
jgi:hypothetical protein